MKIYISLPISGKNVMTQTGIALSVVEQIRSIGHEPVNPFDTPLAPLELTEQQKYAYYMGEDIKRLLMRDAAYFCEGWRGSNGCLLEFNAAQIYNLMRYVNINDIPAAK